MKVLANDGIALSGQQVLEKAGFTVVTDTVAQDQLVNEINDKGYEVLLVRSATKVRTDIIDGCPNLKMIGRGGVGMDNIDVDYAREKGKKVFNTPAASSQSVAELVMGQLFTIARSTFDSNREMPGSGATSFKSLKKKYAKGVELRGKTIGIIGFGRIGQCTAQYAIGCGMNVIAADPFVKEARIPVQIGTQKLEFEIEMLSNEALYQKADFITLHVPMPADGKALIGEEELAIMKDGVRLVNAARGGVIDEDALMNALNNGKVAAAALDVFVNEPTPRIDVLEHPSISLTPHIGAATLEAQDRIGIELASQILEFYQVNA